MGKYFAQVKEKEREGVRENNGLIICFRSCWLALWGVSCLLYSCLLPQGPCLPTAGGPQTVSCPQGLRGEGSWGQPQHGSALTSGRGPIPPASQPSLHRAML